MKQLILNMGVGIFFLGVHSDCLGYSYSLINKLPVVAHVEMWIGSTGAFSCSGRDRKFDLQPEEVYEYNGEGCYISGLGFDAYASVDDVYTLKWNGSLNNQPWETMPGGLVQISVASMNHIWGVTAAGVVYQWVKDQWEKRPGNLKQIAVGADGSVWGINAAGSVFKWSSSKNSWQDAPGKLINISVGNDGAVCGINSHGAVFIWHDQGNAWADLPSPGNVTQIAVGSIDHIWCVTAAGVVYRWIKDHWEGMPGTLKQVAVSADGIVWGINPQGVVYKWISDSWTVVKGQLLDQVAVGFGGVVWGIYQQKIVRYNTQPFKQVSGKLKHIAAGNAQQVYGINDKMEIWKWTNGQFVRSFTGAHFKNMSVAADGTAWGIGDDDTAWSLNQKTHDWQHMSNKKIKQLAVGSATNIWAVDDQTNIYKWVGGNWVLQSGQATQISAAADGSVWCVNGGNVFAWEHDAWVLKHDGKSQPGPLSYVSVGRADYVWALNKAGEMFLRSNDNWLKIPGRLTQISAAADGVVWGVDGVGNGIDYHGFVEYSNKNIGWNVNWEIIPTQVGENQHKGNGSLREINRGQGTVAVEVIVNTLKDAFDKIKNFFKGINWAEIGEKTADKALSVTGFQLESLLNNIKILQTQAGVLPDQIKALQTDFTADNGLIKKGKNILSLIGAFRAEAPSLVKTFGSLTVVGVLTDPMQQVKAVMAYQEIIATKEALKQALREFKIIPMLQDASNLIESMRIALQALVDIQYNLGTLKHVILNQNAIDALKVIITDLGNIKPKLDDVVTNGFYDVDKVEHDLIIALIEKPEQTGMVMKKATVSLAMIGSDISAIKNPANLTVMKEKLKSILSIAQGIPNRLQERVIRELKSPAYMVSAGAAEIVSLGTATAGVIAGLIVAGLVYAKYALNDALHDMNAPMIVILQTMSTIVSHLDDIFIQSASIAHDFKQDLGIDLAPTVTQNALESIKKFGEQLTQDVKSPALKLG